MAMTAEMNEKTRIGFWSKRPEDKKKKKLRRYGNKSYNKSRKKVVEHTHNITSNQGKGGRTAINHVAEEINSH